MRKVLQTVLIDLAVMAVLLIAGEAGVRVFYPQAARYLFSSTLTGGHPIHLNSHGLRDEEFPEARPAGERRILCLGDSTTFGAGIAAEETYPKQMERLLNEAPEGRKRWRVINAGGQGASVTGLTEYLERQGLAFKPEAVVLGFSPTMVGVAGRHTDEAAPQETAGRTLRGMLLSLHVRLHSSYLYVLFDANLRKRLYRWGVIQDRMDARQGALFAYAFDVPEIQKPEVEEAYGKLEREISLLKKLLAAKRIPLIVLNIPSRFRISDSPEDNERGYDPARIRIDPTDRVAVFCWKMGIPFSDLRPALGQLRQKMLRGEIPWDDLYTPTDYAHLNPRGMREAAILLLQKRTGRGQWAVQGSNL